MIILGYFILGILFVSFILPLLEQLLAIISALCDFIVYKYAFKVYKIKKDMGLDEQQQDQDLNIIGFGPAPIIEQQEEY